MERGRNHPIHPLAIRDLTFATRRSLLAIRLATQHAALPATRHSPLAIRDLALDTWLSALGVGAIGATAGVMGFGMRMVAEYRAAHRGRC